MSNRDRRETASPLEPDLDREGHGDITGKPKAGSARDWDIREGMTVYGDDDRPLGRVGRIDDTDFDVAGRRYGRDRILRTEGDRLYLRRADATGQAVDRAAGEVRVPVAEERLNVGKREVDLGAVEVRKTVTEEEQTVPVTLRREEVNVREERVEARPTRDAELFQEGTIRVPVRGEEPVVEKETVVTGEVVVDKETVAEEREVSGTVRKQHVDVDRAYREARPGFERDFNARRAAATTDWGRGRTFAQAEPHYRTGFAAAHDARYAGREFDDIEPELRRDYERGTTTRTGTTGDSWEQLREEIRQGWNRARGRY